MARAKSETPSQKITRDKKAWGCGSRGRMLASQTQRPEFKPQFDAPHKKTPKY
jgi:hypothetical protein